jgi:hypothetical protein
MTQLRRLGEMKPCDQSHVTGQVGSGVNAYVVCFKSPEIFRGSPRSLQVNTFKEATIVSFHILSNSLVNPVFDTI